MKGPSHRLLMLLPLFTLAGCEQSAPPPTSTAEQAPSAPVEQIAAPAEPPAPPPAAPLTGDALYNSDKAPDSILYDYPQHVVDGVWSAIGATAPITYANAGHNNNLSFVITPDGVLVVNAGGCYLLAKALHEEIKKRTDQPVKYVVLENGQAHAALGSNYWQEQGVPVIAHEDAAQEIADNKAALVERVTNVIKEQAEGTVVVAPDETFSDRKIIEMGGVRIEVLHLGPTHSPGDTVVWLPQKSVVISGDMAFHQRMLPLFEHTDSAGWLDTWEKFAALDAQYVIPGHGVPTDMAEVTRYTKDYLTYLRGEVRKVIDNGGGMVEAYKIDQSAYAHLPTAEFLSRRNAGQVFQSMEFE